MLRFHLTGQSCVTHAIDMMATIHSKYIHRYKLPDTSNTLKKSVNDTNLRIIEITDSCSTDNEGSLLRIKSDNIKKLLLELNESPNLFFVTIKLESKHFDKTICEGIIRDVCDSLMRCGKYFLIEICHGVKNIARYTMSGETIEELSNEQLGNFFEAVDDSLLLSGVTSSAFHNLKNVSSMPVPLLCILIRLLRICDLPCPEDIEKTIVESLVRYCNVDCVRAFLDLPQIDDGESIKHTTLTTRAVHYRYTSGVTLLFFAASGDVAKLRLLLRLGADVHAENLFSETASDHTEGKNENLLVLLESDAKFPRNFHGIYPKLCVNCNDDGLAQRVCKIYEERQKLHKAIVDKDQKFIAWFEEIYPNSKFAYTTVAPAVSRAATTTALIDASETNDYTTYLYLISKGFCVNDKELYFMTKADKNKVGAIILNRLKIEQQSHVSFLSGKTFLSGVDASKQREYKDKMVKIYKKLNSFSKLASILKVVEHSKSLTVSVDFRNESVLHLDMNASNAMDGLTYHNIGRIYLSVAGKDDTEIGGLIIHELTHFALHIIFNNHGYPYHKFDVDKERRFKRIVDEVRKCRKNLPQLVNDMYDAYSESSWPKELIARVPQLISMKSSSHKDMAELFEFYRVDVLPYMDRLTRNPEDLFIKREVDQLNEFLRHVEEIEKWNIELDTTCLDEAIYDERHVKKVICNIPRLFLTDFHNEVVKKGLTRVSSDADLNTLKQSDKYIIFASIEDFVNSSTSAYVQRVWNLTSNITLVLDVEKFLDLKSTLQTSFLKVVSKNMIVFGPDQSAMDSITAQQSSQYFTVNYTWQHLKKCYRDALLSRPINFQSAMIPLNKLIDDDFGNDIPMKQLIVGEEINIAKSVDDYDGEVFVERRVKYFDRECATSEVLSLSATPITSFLLSGCPGSGQSIVLSHIASLHKETSPHFWVAKVNIEQLAAIASTSMTEVVHFDTHLFSSTSTSAFEFEFSLFQRLYQKSEVIFLLDSFVDLSDEYVDQAISFIKKLSEKCQLWITVHANSPATIKLEEELSNKIVLELQPFAWSDHSSCITKMWQKQLRIAAANETVLLQSYVTQLITYYQDFIEHPKLTAAIADKYLTYVSEHITRYRDEPFEPGNIHTNDGIIDIYDLHKDLYLEKIHRRHQQDTTNEKAASVVLGMNMFTAFEQFADYFLARNSGPEKSLAMYRNGADDLLRNGILDHNLELSRIGTGRYFFLSNYIVRSMESTSTLYGRLCEIISFRRLPSRRKLLKLIDGRMKDSILFCGVIDFRSAPFAQQYDSSYPRLKWDDAMHLVNEDAILLLCFILEFPSTMLKECFDECSLFWRASEKGLRCVVEILWNISNAKFNKFLTQVDSLGCNPFQYAFLNFPRSDVDVVRDTTTTAFELSEALRKQEMFQKTLNKSTVEKYQNSTLNFLVDKILSSKTADGRNILIYQHYKHPAIDECKISSRHFDESIECKWMAMTHLQFPLTDWMELTTQTIFENVIHIIFNEYNNHVVAQFYKWAEAKVGNADTFKKFVEDTFVNFFWNCTSVKHCKEIVNFVRNKINIEETLTERGIKIFNSKFANKIAAYLASFTAREFEIILFQMPMGDDEGNFMTRICCCMHAQTIYQTCSAIALEKIIERVEVSVHLVHTLLWFMVGTLDELRDESLIEFIVEFVGRQDREIISKALDTMTDEGSFFNLAFLRQDMFMVKLVWQVAKSYLDEEQFRCILLDPYNVYSRL